MRDNRELNEHDQHYVPSYCFNWQDGQEMNAPHKQSGDIDNPKNFENHKAASVDRVDGRELSVWDSKKLAKTYQIYFNFIKENRSDYPKELLEKYGY